ncbi:hypothetical protein ACFQZ4_43830 [Catellatospora coxensis]
MHQGTRDLDGFHTEGSDHHGPADGHPVTIYHDHGRYLATLPTPARNTPTHTGLRPATGYLATTNPTAAQDTVNPTSHHHTAAGFFTAAPAPHTAAWPAGLTDKPPSAPTQSTNPPPPRHAAELQTDDTHRFRDEDMSDEDMFDAMSDDEQLPSDERGSDADMDDIDAMDYTDDFDGMDYTDDVGFSVPAPAQPPGPPDESGGPDPWSDPQLAYAEIMASSEILLGQPHTAIGATTVEQSGSLVRLTEPVTANWDAPMPAGSPYIYVPARAGALTENGFLYPAGTVLRLRQFDLVHTPQPGQPTLPRPVPGYHLDEATPTSHAPASDLFTVRAVLRSHHPTAIDPQQTDLWIDHTAHTIRRSPDRSRAHIGVAAQPADPRHATELTSYITARLRNQLADLSPAPVFQSLPPPATGHSPNELTIAWSATPPDRDHAANPRSNATAATGPTTSTHTAYTATAGGATSLPADNGLPFQQQVQRAAQRFIEDGEMLQTATEQAARWRAESGPGATLWQYFEWLQGQDRAREVPELHEVLSGCDLNADHVPLELRALAAHWWDVMKSTNTLSDKRILELMGGVTKKATVERWINQGLYAQHRAWRPPPQVVQFKAGGASRFAVERFLDLIAVQLEARHPVLSGDVALLADRSSRKGPSDRREFFARVDSHVERIHASQPAATGGVTAAPAVVGALPQPRAYGAADPQAPPGPSAPSTVDPALRPGLPPSASEVSVLRPGPAGLPGDHAAQPGTGSGRGRHPDAEYWPAPGPAGLAAAGQVPSLYAGTRWDTVLYPPPGCPT